jgi:hypothetical protein
MFDRLGDDAGPYDDLIGQDLITQTAIVWTSEDHTHQPREEDDATGDGQIPKVTIGIITSKGESQRGEQQIDHQEDDTDLQPKLSQIARTGFKKLAVHFMMLLSKRWK